MDEKRGAKLLLGSKVASSYEKLVTITRWIKYRRVIVTWKNDSAFL